MGDHNSGFQTKEKIIKATMDIIAAQGFQNVTIRKIAAMAGVNVSAINYHFGTKDALINEALKIITLQLKNSFQHLKEEQIPPEERLQLFVKAYAETVFEYPDIIRYMINQLIYNDRDCEVEYQEYLKDEGVELIKDTIGEVLDETDLIIYMKTLQLLSAFSFPVLLGHQVKGITGVDISRPEIRDNYSDLLLKNILGN
ncbi:TetR/AcrR family transcriptional regulator [Syntrophomonas erecta]